MMVNWTLLPNDIIHKVASDLEAIEDFFAFSAVCSSWRSVYATKWCPGPQDPWLMLSHKENSTSLRFLSMYSEKVRNLELPTISDKHWLGTSSEWLLTIGSNHEMQLINMFTRVTKSLPPGSSLDAMLVYLQGRRTMIQKALVVKKPCASGKCNDEDELLVIIIFGRLQELAFCRPGYCSWVRLRYTDYSGILDVACVKNEIFALSRVGALVTLDVDGQHPPKVVYVTTPNATLCFKLPSLVQSCGELWMVYKYIVENDRKPFDYKSIGFHVDRLDVSRRQWIEVENLGDRAIFLGGNCCLSVCAPERWNCKSNSVYYAINMRDWLSAFEGSSLDPDLGVYDMAKGCVEPLCSFQDIPEHFRPSWVMPSFG